MEQIYWQKFNKLINKYNLLLKSNKHIQIDLNYEIEINEWNQKYYVSQNCILEKDNVI